MGETNEKRPAVLVNHDDGFGGWVTGVVLVGNRMFDFEAKHFSDGSRFGIDGGRISKLRITLNFPSRPPFEVCAYDRGWVTEPSAYSDGCEAIPAAYNAILEKFN